MEANRRGLVKQGNKWRVAVFVDDATADVLFAKMIREHRSNIGDAAHAAMLDGLNVRTIELDFSTTLARIRAASTLEEARAIAAGVGDG